MATRVLVIEPASNQTVNDIMKNLEMEKTLEGRSIRVGLGVVSTLLGLFMIYRVLLDNWRSKKISYGKFDGRFSFLFNLHPAEVFPLVLGFGIVIQEMIFVVAQSVTLNQVMTGNCKEPGVFLLPSIMLLGILHIVFGLELTLRSFKRRAFSNGPDYLFVANLITSFVIFFIILIVAQTKGTEVTSCAGGNIFMVASLQMNNAILTLLSIYVSLFLIMATVIAIKLKRTIHIDPAQRITASRMVYYLLLTAVIEATVIPFFANEVTTYSSYPYGVSNLAEYIIVMSGALVAFLHLFLRTNAARMAIKPSDAPWLKKRYFRFFGPSDLEIINISPPLNLVYPKFHADEKRIIKAPSGRRYHSLPSSPSISYPVKPPPLSIPQNKRLNKEYVSTPLSAGSSTIRSPGRTIVKESISTPLTGRYSTDLDSVIEAYRPTIQSAGHKPTYSIFPIPSPKDSVLPSTVYSPTTSLRSKTRLPATPRSFLPPITSPVLPASTYNPRTPKTPTLPNIRESSVPPNPSSQLPSLPPTPPPKPTSAPWTQRRTAIAATAETVPVGIRLSNVPNGLVPGQRPPSGLPTIETILETGPVKLHMRSAPFDEAFACAFKDQVKDAMGRDLNSFQWVGVDEDENVGGLKIEEIPVSPGTVWKTVGSEMSGSMYEEDEEKETGFEKNNTLDHRSSKWV